MRHISARIAWHDGAWNSAVCSEASCNASCIVHDYIRKSRDDKREDNEAGRPFADLEGYLPPCSYEAATYGSQGYRIQHTDPVDTRGLPACPDEVRPFSTFVTPYRWMREENFADICQDEGLAIRAASGGKERGWVSDDDRQRALLEAFWSKVAPNKSLVFYYAKDGNPVDEDAGRLLIGVGRISEIGPMMFFGQHPKYKGQFPVWARSVTQAWPNEGVRIPYQEYLAKGHNPVSIACTPPGSQALGFSYVAEHLSDGAAAMVLDRVVRSIEQVQSDALIDNYDCEGALKWLSGALDEVWSGRGAYPGVGALLRALGFGQGMHFHFSVLAAKERSGEDPWRFMRAILEGREDIPSASYEKGLINAREKWRALKNRHALLEALVRFELTETQFLDLISEVDRVSRGITATTSAIIENPYLLCEQDCGTNISEPVAIEVIDQGVRPEGAARAFGDPWEMAQDDKRRVRAVSNAVLKQAAAEGHSFLPMASLMERVRGFFPERRVCRPDEEVVLGQEDFHASVLTFEEVEDVPVVALKSLREREEDVSSAFRTMMRKSYDDAPEVDWSARLLRELGNPETERQRNALDEKTIALERLYRNRISVLTGGAGTGKTRALKIFVDALNEVEPMRPMLLLAPTGKARVRLAENTKRRAQTIHQVLSKQNLIGPGFSLLTQTSEPPQKAATVIIDEASMPSVDLLASLLKAVDVNAIKRLIFVGDPFQLPPIGPGRPFAELVEEMRRVRPYAVGELYTCMRIVEVDGAAMVSPGLELAATYRNEAAPDDDAILSQLASGQALGDVEIAVWKDRDALRDLIKEKLKAYLDIGAGDYESFNRSLGFDTECWEETENWQILTPTRQDAFGATELNRQIQGEFRGAMQKYARNPWKKMPRPFGQEEIVRGDKVINVINDRAFCHPQEKGLSFLANGEIGMVSGAYNKGGVDRLCVGFSSQSETMYFFKRGEIEERLELAYALTVHKAQGSDFDLVFLVLPQEARTLSRELLYTALTRFRKQLVILVERDIAPLLRLRAANASDARRRCSRLFVPHIPWAILPQADPRTPIYADRLKHRTGEGVKVRSKSEVIVAYVLEKLGLSPEYEVPLQATNGNPNDFRLPDFTISHEGETWYWEHLGMLHVPKYAASWKAKQAWYQKNGYANRVITSRDGPDGEIHADEIERIARETLFDINA